MITEKLVHFNLPSGRTVIYRRLLDTDTNHVEFVSVLGQPQNQNVTHFDFSQQRPVPFQGIPLLINLFSAIENARSQEVIEQQLPSLEAIN